jgi:hypothetical protein
MGTNFRNQLLYVWSIYRPFVLNTVWKREFVQMMIFVYVCSTCSVVELKTWFEIWIARNEVNGVIWFHFYYLIKFGSGHLAYLCSQWAPAVEIKYFMCDWSIYNIFVVNTGLKRDSLQMMILAYVCSTCSVVELKRNLKLE